MVFPSAQSYVQEVLRSPRHDSPLNDKLVHNNKVYHFFKEPGLRYNSKHLLRSRDVASGTPKIDGLKNLSQISHQRLEKLGHSARRIGKVLGHAHQPSIFATQPLSPKEQEEANEPAKLTREKPFGSRHNSFVVSRRPSLSPLPKIADRDPSPKGSPEQQQVRDNIQNILQQCNAMKGNSYGELSESL